MIVAVPWEHGSLVIPKSVGKVVHTESRRYTLFSDALNNLYQDGEAGREPLNIPACAKVSSHVAGGLGVGGYFTHITYAWYETYIEDLEVL